MRLLVEARNLLPRRKGCRLRWTIDVQEPPRPALLQNLPDPFRLDQLASKQEVPQAAKGRREFTRHVVEEGRREEHDSNAVRFELRSQRLRRERHVLSMMTRRAPDSSAPQTSKVAASKELFETWATTSPSSSVT